MGLVAIDIALHGYVKPSLVVVTDIDNERLKRAESIFSMQKSGSGRYQTRVQKLLR